MKKQTNKPIGKPTGKLKIQQPEQEEEKGKTTPTNPNNTQN